MHVPYHKSEKMFRRYEKHIFAFLREYPKPVAFDPKPLASTTFSCRLRDSIGSVLEYNWTTCVDVARLRELWPLCSVRVVNGNVVLGPKDTDQSTDLRPAGHIISSVDDKNDFAFELDRPEKAELVAAALLLARGHLKKPVKIKNVPRAMLDELANNFDVGISEDVDHFIML